MYELSQELAILLTLQGEKKRKLFTLEREKEKLEFDLTPPEGWQGKNEMERTVIRQLTFSNNGPWIANKLQLEEVRSELFSVEADIASVQAEQEGLKWLIRNETNIVMGGRDWLDEAMLMALDGEVDDHNTIPLEAQADNAIRIKSEPIPATDSEVEETILEGGSFTDDIPF